MAAVPPSMPSHVQLVRTLTCDELAEGLPYDPASQVTSILHQLTATNSPINKAEYLYNPVGNRTSLTDKRGSQAFGYDQLDRLTSASHPLLGTPQSFAYDAVGNRTTAGNVTNAGNQLTADATHSYQYDDNGNLTRKTLLATGNYTQYTYDPENRLTKVEDFVAGNSTAAFTSTYRYDGLGRRIEKVANASTGSAQAGQTKRYIYDGEDILLEYDGTNTLQARYTHGPGIDEPIAVTKGASTFFYHQDGLGSVTDLTDSAGAAAKSYSYDAYGNILESPGTVEQPYSYTGREFDSESGLMYYRARYYDPATGRFLQKDPIGPKETQHAYRYVNDNPINFVDPAGLYPIDPSGCFAYNSGPPTTKPVSRATAGKICQLKACLGIDQLVVTGGSEDNAGGKPRSRPHQDGEAADLSFKRNPTIKAQKDKFMCCAKKAGFGFATEEGPGTKYPQNPPQIHVQTPPGRGKDQGELPSQTCGC